MGLDPAVDEDDQDLSAVRRRLAAVGAEAGEPALAAHASGGKLLRAQIVLLVSRLGTLADSTRAIQLATAIELLHAGALCHDDVVDGSLVRRSRPTIEATHGTRAAVLAGLFLMLRGLAVLAHGPARLRRAVARALRDAARGQTDEALDLFETDVSPEAYLRRAQAKTGALYELAGRLGADASALEGLALDGVAAYAASFGVAFQLADDLRDLLGGPGLGREPGTDLRQGVYTLPVLLTLSGRHPGAEALRQLLSQGARAIAPSVALLRANGALAETERLAAERVERARAALGLFPASAVRQRLETLVGSILSLGHAERSAAWRPTPAPRRSAFPSVPTHDLFFLSALDGDLSARLAVVAERLRTELRVTLFGAQGWVDSIATATALGTMLLWLADLVTDATPGGGARMSSADNTTVVGSIDLAVATLADLLAKVPAAAGLGLTEALSRRAVRALAQLSTDPTCSIQLDHDDIHGLVDEVTAATVRCRAGEQPLGS